MSNNISGKHAMKRNMEKLVQEVLDILNADDGKSFEEKKEAVARYLKKGEERSVAETMAALTESDDEGSQIKNRFWSFGEIACMDEGISLRQVEDRDREGYLEIQREYSLTKSMLKEKAYCNIVWNEHNGDKTLYLSIIKTGATSVIAGSIT